MRRLPEIVHARGCRAFAHGPSDRSTSLARHFAAYADRWAQLVRVHAGGRVPSADDHTLLVEYVLSLRLDTSLLPEHDSSTPLPDARAKAEVFHQVRGALARTYTPSWARASELVEYDSETLGELMLLATKNIESGANPAAGF